MALVLKADVGAVDANTYITKANATIYFESHMESALWTAGSALQDIALVHACRQIDQLSFRGEKVTPTQALKFPTTNQTWIGERVAVTVIPEVVKQAQCEQALYLIKHEGPSRRDELRADGVTQFGMKAAGGKSIGGRRAISICPMAHSLLHPYLRKGALTV